MTLTDWTPSFFPETPLRLNELDNTISSGCGRVGQPDMLLKIDDDIARLRDTAFQLLTRRNACTLLLSLPPELATEIIKTLHAIWPAYSRPKTVAGDYSITEWEADMGWLQIGHVCRALRSIALRRTELWAATLQFFPRSMDDMLPRCGEEPLALYLDGSSTSPTFGGRPLQFCLENLSRCRTLTVHEGQTRPPVWPVDPAVFSCQQLPFLKSLTIHAARHPDSYNRLTADIHELPAIAAPRLTHLELSNYMLSFAPSTLTSLSIRFDHPTCLHTPSQFVEMLSRCPALQSLELARCIPELELTLAGASRPIDLPLLERLKLEDKAMRCHGFWRCLATKPTSNVHTTLLDVMDYLPEHGSHLQLITEFMASASIGTFSGLAVCDHDYDNPGLIGEEETDIGSFYASFYTSDPEEHPTEGTGPFAHDFKEAFMFYYDDVDRVRPHFPMALSTLSAIVANGSSITVLEISSGQRRTGPTADFATWSSFFSSLPLVETLYIEANEPYDVLYALGRHGDSDAAPVLLPALKCLWLKSLDFGRVDGDQTINRVMFIRMLAYRSQRGAALEHLRVDELTMAQGDIAASFIPRLRAFVPVVECPNINDAENRA